MSKEDFIEPDSGRNPLTNLDQPTVAESPGTHTGADPATLHLDGVPGGGPQHAPRASEHAESSGQGASTHRNVEEGKRYDPEEQAHRDDRGGSSAA